MKKKTVKTLVYLSAITICCLGAVASVNAQQSGTAGQEMTPMHYDAPQKPEDISPLLYGEKIPAVMLPDATGKEFDLNRSIAEKPAILIFYRGGWCPYCSKQLSGLQQAMPELEAAGYQMIAISTDLPAGLAQSASKQKLSYTLLSDADLTVAKQFGLAYKAPAGYWDLLTKTTGGKDADQLLPVPSVFIVDKAGVIRFEYINPDFKQRADIDLLKAAANSIRKTL